MITLASILVWLLLGSISAIGVAYIQKEIRLNTLLLLLIAGPIGLFVVCMTAGEQVIIWRKK